MGRITSYNVCYTKLLRLVCDSCFLSGLLKIETIDDEGNKQKTWRPKQVYHYIQWKNLEPDIIVDVSGYMDIKMDAVMAYKTQFYDANSKEPITPIATKNVITSYSIHYTKLYETFAILHSY